MGLLSIVQTAAGELNLTVPTIVATSTDAQTKQLMALANRAQRDMAVNYAWQALRTEYTFTTVASDAQPAAAVPTDFDRWVNNSFWNRTTRLPVLGPVTPQQWQAMKAQAVFASAYLVFVERRGVLMMQPTPPAGQLIYGEYISTNLCKTTGGTPQPSFVNDTDVSYLNEDVLTLGLIWRWLARKGLDYSEAMSDYERTLEITQARDGGATVLSLGGSGGTPRPVREGNFGV